jgi:phosphoribosylformylglycinamidine synthase
VGRRALPIAILSIEGTNCDAELATSLRTLGAQPEIVHLKQLETDQVSADERRRLTDYAVLFLPGGFSAGDYVRAGAIFAARIRASIGPELEAFVRDGRLVGGICNGFQILTELGLLPGVPGGRLGPPGAALMTNDSNRFECRPTFIAWQGGTFPPLQAWPKGERLYVPSAHAEGKLILPGAPGERLRELEEAGQVLFRWVAPDGSAASYPWNPNGSEGNVAGISNPEGNVFGLMPHPERSFFTVQRVDWTRREHPEGLGDGARLLEAVVSYAERHA